jgi:Ca2+-binding RTX toxin-like protein
MDIRGTESADVLNGGAGDDVIYGFGGNDTLKGGGGDDVLAGNEGNDILRGGDGDDYIQGGAGNDTIDGGAGSDWAGYDDATVGVKVDLNISGAQNTVGSGTDKLTGIENLHGSAFNDTLIGDAKDNIIIGDAGADTISGGKGGDTLWGSAGADALDGGDGDDWLVGGAGDDVIKGGAGSDWASYEDATAGVKVDLTKTTAQDTGGAGKDTLSGVENLWGSAFDDTLTGDAGSNYLFGAAGNDTLTGGAGDDFFAGGAGVNVLDGGDGNDTIDYAMSDVGVDIDLTRNTATSRTDATIKDTLSSIELVTGSTHDDLIVGNMAENYLFGDAGNDVLTAVGGHDTLDGGDGDDILRGSFYKPGDMLLGGAGDDQIIVWAGPGSEGDATIVDGGSGVDDLIFSTAADITLNLANTGDQVISPGVHMEARNFENVRGGAGNDRLTGDAGGNILNGGAGNDVLDGGAGFDIASYEGGPGVRVDLSKAGVAQDTQGAGMDTLINIEGLRGSSLGDILIGDAKDNTLDGGMGNDILDGGAGVDTAVYVGAATDYTWTLNANGTWTVKGLEGVDTLLNVETLKFNDKSVTLSPSTTTVTVDELVNPKTLVTSTGPVLSDAILSADGRTAYVGTGEGHVAVIDTATGQTRTDIKVGTALGGMDVSQDGRYLVVAERMMLERSSPGGSPAPMAVVHVVDLRTGLVKDYTTFANGSDRGFQDAAFTSDGKVVLTQNFAGSGNTAITVLDPTTGSFTFSTAKYGQSGVMSVTDDHSKVLLAPTNGSWGELFLLAPGAVQTAAHNQFGNFDGVSGFNFGIQAIAGDGSKIVQWIYPGQINVYDAALKHLVELSAYSPYSMTVHGMDFSADGEHLYVVDAVKDQIFDFSTETWSLNEVYAIGANIAPAVESYGAGAAFGDSVTLSNDGRTMLIMDDHKVVSVNMSMLKLAGGADAADTLQAVGGGDLLRGFGGDDTLKGGDGRDTLVGGLGADKLTGGLGADTFVFAKGDTTWSPNADAGVDVITDWEATDRLSFGPTGGEIIHYGEQTTSSWLAAATTAPQIMGSLHLSHLAMQVGADVYVFAGNGKAVENVVKLANTTLDKISADNILPVGDDSANILIGGALNDRIYGYGGNDTIKAGKGVDVMFGGAGSDTFIFEAGDTTWTRLGNNDVDVIQDWDVSDKLAFGPLGASFALEKAGFYTWQEAATWASGTSANAIPTYKVYQVGADVYVFYVPNGATGEIENVVKLANTSLDKITQANFVPDAGTRLNGDDGANVLTAGALNDTIDGKGGDDVITGGKGNDTLTGGAGADVFKFLAGEGQFDTRLHNFDTITDFGAGDKLAFTSAPTVVKEGDIMRMTAHVGADGLIDMAEALYIDAYNTQIQNGALGQRYLVVDVGADTYVLADTDPRHGGYDTVVLLKGVTSSLVTADMFMAA